MTCRCSDCDSPPAVGSRHCRDCKAAGCAWSDECANVAVCFRCGGEPETTDFEGRAVCADCIETLTDRDTTRSTDQAGLGDY